MDNNGLGRSPYFMRSTRIAASTRIPRLVVQSAPAPVPQTPPPKSSSTAIPQAPQSNRTRRAGPSPQIEPMRIQPTGHNSELDLTTWNPPPSPTSDTRRGQLAKTVDFKRSEPLAHDAPYPWGEVTNIMEVAWRRNRPGPVPREGANTGTKPPTKAALDLNKRDQMDSVILVPTLVQAYAPDVAELLLNTPLDLRARTEENSEDHDLVSIIKFCLSGPTLGDELQSEKDVEIWFHGSVLAPAIAVLQFLKKRDEGLFTPSYDALHVSSAKSYSAVVPDALFAILKRGEKAIQIGKILIAMEMKTSVLFGDDGFGVFDDLYKCGTRLGNAIKFNWPRAEELEEEGSDSEEASIVGEEDEIKSAFEKMGGSKASEVLVQVRVIMTRCTTRRLTSVS
ncbi:hypothetical protein PENSPDRAFT_656222 [Peniophora sp. CONT]|nr:hypothetical protein PENSPDRAFT_656222 [Peniophora sp. CONT]